MTGYGVIDFDELDEAKVFCNNQVSRFRRLRVVDRHTYTGRSVGVLYEVPEKTR